MRQNASEQSAAEAEEQGYSDEAKTPYLAKTFQL
jgi:hypothetical protein